MALTQEQYDEYAQTIKSGKGITHNGRSAVSMTDLAFIARAESVLPTDSDGVENELNAIDPEVSDTITVTHQQYVDALDAAVAERTIYQDKALTSLSARKDELEQQNTDLQTEIVASHQETATLQQENATLKARITELEQQGVSPVTLPGDKPIVESSGIVPDNVTNAAAAEASSDTKSKK